MDSLLNQEPTPQKLEQKIQKLQDRNDVQDDNKNQVSRRSRKDIEGRDFVCGCGKKYLSYPALYTHIKTKHDGRQPEGTMKYSTAAPAKKTKTKLQEEHLNEMSSLVTKDDIRLLQFLGQKFSGSTSLSSRLKSKILQKQITDTYHSLLKNTTSPLKLNKQSSLQQHLIAYLIGVGEFITQRLHEQYQWFARTVKQCYYQMGLQVYNKCFSKKQGGLCYIPNFKVQRVKYFPLICDFYIRFFLPYEYSELNSNLMELILTDFCNWLNRRKCTFIQIMLNKQYKLNAPLQFEQEVKNQKLKREEEQEKYRSELQDIESDAPENQKSHEQRKQHSYQENQQINEMESLNSQNEKNNPIQNLGQTPIHEQGQQSENPQDQMKPVENQPIQSRQNGNVYSHQKDLSLQVEPAAPSSQEISEVENQILEENGRNQSVAPQCEHQESLEQSQKPQSDKQ